MDIFESLENLNVSEECFDEIMGIVEDIVSMAKKSGNQDLVNRAENAKEAGRKATEKKEFKRIQDNKTRKDIHPSVLKSAEKRDEAVKGLAQNKSRGYLDSEDSNDEEKAKAIAQARAEGRENKRTVGLDKTLNKQKPTYYTDYGETEVGGGDPSYERLVRSTKDTDNHPYGNSNVNAEDNIRNSNGVRTKKIQHNETTDLPDYQHKKKIATKALKGHNKNGSLDSGKIDKKVEHLRQYSEKGYDNSDGYETGRYLLKNKGENGSKTPVTTSPKALYKLGKAIENRKNKNK